MSELRASRVDLSALGRVLQGEVVDRSAVPPRLERTDDFREGQISGPLGPQFVGYGPLPRAPLMQRLAPIGLGLACGAGALAIELARGNI